VSPPVPSIQNRSSAPCPLALDSILHVIFVGISSRFDQIFHVLYWDKFVLPYLLSYPLQVFVRFINRTIRLNQYKVTRELRLDKHRPSYASTLFANFVFQIFKNFSLYSRLHKKMMYYIVNSTYLNTT
jgi:hypothetical protein